MKGFGLATYGDRIVSLYDTWYAEEPDTEGTVDALTQLAGRGPVLELGIGTGRVAIPLVERGVEVHGIEASERMVERLRDKSFGGDIPVTIGDFQHVERDESYSLVFCVFSTFFCLPSQEAQLRCFANVARRLQPDGLFVVEAFVPDLARYNRRQSVSIGRIEADEVVLVTTKLDPAEQTMQMQHIVVSEHGIRLAPAEVRYAWPSELDLMARMAGLRLRARTQNWRGDQYTGKSTGHISVYEPAR
ncbi:MAG TPA: class I SAM-dependent methyltransferase [Candidatus Dormibacteraeota bacterium]|nr:class I SAM-dependent methyltransferase [Candidatus Dormibacteraeota bacterium]